MQQSRRTFLVCAAISSVAMMTTLPSIADQHKEKKKRILFLGGTGFLGPHMVKRAVDAGHQVTIFNRGKTKSTLFPELFDEDTLTWLIGDRYGDISALNEGEWDSVVDTFTYTPDVVRRTVDLLAPRIKQYIVVSTMSVYGQRSDVDMDETAPLATVPDDVVERVKSHRDVGQHYGGFKALCEQTAEQGMPGRVCSVRPGLIVGAGDRTNRFTYWPYRVRKGGDMLAPGESGHYVQFIDVRDCANFTVLAAEKKLTGAYNAISEARQFTIGGLLKAAKDVTKSDAHFVWVDSEFLQQHNVTFWNHLPAYLPPTLEGYEGFGQASSAKAMKTGLTIRPLEDTIRDTLRWVDEQSPEFIERLEAGFQPGKGGAGMSDDFEKQVLAAWRDNAS